MKRWRRSRWWPKQHIDAIRDITQAALIPEQRQQSGNYATWIKLRSAFCDDHRHPINAGAQFASTLTLLWALASLTRVVDGFGVLVPVGIYLLSLSNRIPRHLWTITAWLLGLVIALALAMHAQPATALRVGAIAFALQQLLQLFVSDIRLQRQGLGLGRFERSFFSTQNINATYYALPLAIASIGRWLVVPDKTICISLAQPSEQKALQKIETWANVQSMGSATLLHRWSHQLPAALHEPLLCLADSSTIGQTLRQLYPEQTYTAFAINSLTEVYVLAWEPNEAAYTRCCIRSIQQSLFWFVPFATLVSGVIERQSNAIPDQVGQFQGCLIQLKLHYLVYPRVLKRYGRLIGRLAQWYFGRKGQTGLAAPVPEPWQLRRSRL